MTTQSENPEAAESNSPAMTETLGSLLRRTRQDKRIALEVAAKETRVHATTLKALEEDNRDELPAEVFTRGFIKIYAQYLGLDPEQALRIYLDHRGEKTAIPDEKVNVQEVLAGETMADPPSFHAERHLFTAAVVILVSLILYLGYKITAPPPPSEPPKPLVSEPLPQQTPPPTPETVPAEKSAPQQLPPAEGLPTATNLPAPATAPAPLAPPVAAPATALPPAVPAKIAKVEPLPPKPAIQAPPTNIPKQALPPQTNQTPTALPPLAQPAPVKPAVSPKPALPQAATPAPATIAPARVATAPLPPRPATVAPSAPPAPSPPTATPGATAAKPPLKELAPAGPIKKEKTATSAPVTAPTEKPAKEPSTAEKLIAAIKPMKPPYALEATFREDTWVRIQVDGEKPKPQYFRAGEKSSWRANSKMQLFIGNAGGVDLTLNNTKLPPLGKPGNTTRISIQPQPDNH